MLEAFIISAVGCSEGVSLTKFLSVLDEAINFENFNIWMVFEFVYHYFIIISDGLELDHEKTLSCNN